MSIFNQNDFIKLENISQYNPIKTDYGFYIEMYCVIATNHNFKCNYYLQIRYNEISSQIYIYECQYQRSKKLDTYYINTVFDFNILINKMEMYLLNEVKSKFWRWMGADVDEIEVIYGTIFEDDENSNLY